MIKAWRVLDAAPIGFANSIGLTPFQAQLLYNRGIRKRAEVEPYLTADSRLLNDPMLLPDMDKAVTRLRAALRSGETIGVFGDFDTDGVTGTALLTNALRDMGATVIPYIPDRVDEGHGLNSKALELLRSQGVSLLVTVDCGATSVDEAKLAASLGMDTIITDHHSLLPTLPDACAIINPRRPDSKYPYAHLTGVGMSFKLVQALYEALGRPWPEHLLELVALGTVADVAPLTGENRFLVKKGLESLNRTSNHGLRALAAISGLKLGSLDTESLAFGLIPRLNVAGRLDHANVSLALLTAASAETAERLAGELGRKNMERQSLTEQGFGEAYRQVEARAQSTGVPSIIIVGSKDWMPGILGLIASKLAEHYYRPAIAILLGEEHCRASARSIPEFNVVDALRQNAELFVRFGGHPQAAGFTIRTSCLPDLERRLRALADEKLKDVELTPRIEIESEVTPTTLVGSNFKFIQSLSPFGQENPTPVFLTRSVRILEARQVGGRGQHLKMRVVHNSAVWDAIAFGQGSKMASASRSVDLVYTVGLDTWGARPKLQFTVLDFR
jgi:single-stranded-DNA-specific exonuclease